MIKLNDGRRWEFKELYGVYLVCLHVTCPDIDDPEDEFLCQQCEDHQPSFGRLGEA